MSLRLLSVFSTFVIEQMNKDDDDAMMVMQFTVTRIMHALPASCCLLSKELSGRIDAYLKRCYRYGFSPKIECVDTLSDTACMELFSKMRSSGHCLHVILPPASNHAVL